MKVKIEISSKKVPEKVPESKRVIVVYSKTNYSKPHLNIPKNWGIIIQPWSPLKLPALVSSNIRIKEISGTDVKSGL